MRLRLTMNRTPDKGWPPSCLDSGSGRATVAAVAGIRGGACAGRSDDAKVGTTRLRGAAPAPPRVRPFAGATAAGRGPLAGLDARAGRVRADDPWGDGATNLVYLNQGWRAPETLWYDFADQGSVLLLYEVFVHLEQPDNERRLIDPANLVRHRFLPQRPTPDNPDALPVEWSRHGDAAGLTCAGGATSREVLRPGRHGRPGWPSPRSSPPT